MAPDDEPVHNLVGPLGGIPASAFGPPTPLQFQNRHTGFPLLPHQVSWQRPLPVAPFAVGDQDGSVKVASQWKELKFEVDKFTVSTNGGATTMTATSGTTVKLVPIDPQKSNEQNHSLDEGGSIVIAGGVYIIRKKASPKAKE